MLGLDVKTLNQACRPQRFERKILEELPPDSVLLVNDLLQALFLPLSLSDDLASRENGCGVGQSRLIVCWRLQGLIPERHRLELSRGLAQYVCRVSAHLA